MKQKLLLLLFTFLTTVSFSQSTFGLIGGVNLSKLNGDKLDNTKYKSIVGFNAGFYFDIKLHEVVYLSLQPSFTQEGTRILFKNQDTKVFEDSIQLRMNYASFPLLVKVFTPNKVVYGVAGVETTALINSFLKTDGKTDITSTVTKWNLAMVFGVGVKIKIGYPRLFIEGRYTQGIVNLTDSPNNQTGVIPRVKTSGFKFFTGIEFPLIKRKKKK